MKPTKDQEVKIKEAGKILKEAFPGVNMQFCFNLAQQHSNINYNAKVSGILPVSNLKKETPC